MKSVKEESQEEGTDDSDVLTQADFEVRKSFFFPAPRYKVAGRVLTQADFEVRKSSAWTPMLTQIVLTQADFEVRKRGLQGLFKL